MENGVTMSDGLLEEIILLEKQIQQQLELEEQRVARWQEQELASLDVALKRSQQVLARKVAQELEVTAAQAREDGEDLAQSIEQWCQRLKSLDDQFLRELLTSCLSEVLLEAPDDHPHGQS